LELRSASSKKAVLPFDPIFDPRAAVAVLIDAARLLECELDAECDPLEVEDALDVVRRELGGLLPYLRAWAEYCGHREANAMPETIGAELGLAQTIAFVRNTAALLSRLAATHELRRLN
jgi:hypothetical protein